MIVGHSMGGMLATRFATQYPDMTERLVLYNPIGLVDGRYARPWSSTDEAYKRRSASTYQTNYTAISAVLLSQPHGVEAGVRPLRSHPLRVDAQRRLAAVRDGADAADAGAVSRTPSWTTGPTSRRRRSRSAARKTA